MLSSRPGKHPAKFLDGIRAISEELEEAIKDLSAALELGDTLYL